MSTIVELPDGIQINASSEAEAKILHHEIFVMESYSQFPIHLQDGDCVFDIGANIGLYSIFLSRSRRDLKIFAFEPIPQTFSFLQANAQSVNSAMIQCFQFGLSNQPRIAEFQVDRGLSFMASMYPQEIRQCVRLEADSYEWAIAVSSDLANSSQIAPWLAQGLMWLLNRSVLRVLGLIGLGIVLRYLDQSSKESPQLVTCELSTISEMIRQQRIDKINLVKIDTEGSELDILLGIEPQDWPKINQFIVEIHDIDRRVDTITQLLASKGYKTHVYQQDWQVLKLMNIYTVFATR
jgi:FkbM family methyltransferase